ncbi:hypothetical protein VTH82DRAFT_2333 [Thermothelomyces myriococcoides]
MLWNYHSYYMEYLGEMALGIKEFTETSD